MRLRCRYSCFSPSTPTYFIVRYLAASVRQAMISAVDAGTVKVKSSAPGGEGGGMTVIEARACVLDIRRYCRACYLVASPSGLGPCVVLQVLSIASRLRLSLDREANVLVTICFVVRRGHIRTRVLNLVGKRAFRTPARGARMQIVKTVECERTDSTASLS